VIIAAAVVLLCVLVVIASVVKAITGSKTNAVAPPPPPPPPPPARLPLKYFGYGTLESGPGRRAFLTDGDAVYIVAEGDTVLGRFRVIRITHSSLEFEELVTSRHGVTVLEEQRSAP